ncbi:AAA family ATPase [Stenotrophomonas maltophilia]|uniref:AAA family ATPase n=1 Tax=Stenotrophomonas maltophilia TaxID=40324 RepID=UPI001FA7479F|nr:ATP-binding protein [Stenotrophomonas maltophilia]
MKEQLRNEWVTLMQEGVSGQATRFRLRAMRIAQLMLKANPDLSDALSSGLQGASALTRFSPPAATEAPATLRLEESIEYSVAPHWPREVEVDLRQILDEWQEGEKLAAAGLWPVRTALLHGPPGVGKTLAARWIASNLRLPLATLNLSSTIDSHLGRTGQNVTQALAYARSNACVIFLDEFDALAKRRDDSQDVGELKRVVNVILQAIDDWDGPSLLIAATNHKELLDTAVVRRFETEIEFPPASEQQLFQILKTEGVDDQTAKELAGQLKGQPISNAIRLVRTAKKRHVMESISMPEALRISSDRGNAKNRIIERRRSEARALASTGMSSHQIAKRLGISHTTVLRDLKSITRR